MDIRFQCLGPDQWKAEILIVPVCQGENMLEACPALDNLAPWLAIASCRWITASRMSWGFIS